MALSRRGTRRELDRGSAEAAGRQTSALSRLALTLLIATLITGMAPAVLQAASRARPSPCAEARALESLGRLDAAQSAYLQELANPSGFACAQAGIARIAAVRPSCAYPDALAAVGERATAHTEYLKVLAADPASRCAASGAKRTVAPASAKSVWSRFADAAKNAGYAVGFVVLAVLLVVALALVSLQLPTRLPWLRDHWPAKSIRAPTLKVDDFHDTALAARLGPSVSGLVRGRVTWRRDRFGPTLVTGQAGVASALGGLGDASAEAKAAVSVIEFLVALLPRRSFALNGELQPAGAEGGGISLELSQGASTVALVSFWATPFGLAADEHTKSGQQAGDSSIDVYQQLAIAAAAWTDHWMSRLIGGDYLLTQDPLSWAYFRAGMECQRLGSPGRASALYQQALASDGANAGALANLGIIALRDARYKDAERHLRRALVPLTESVIAPKFKKEHNPDWYRVKYALAVLYGNWSADPDYVDEAGTHTESAAEAARELAQTTLATIGELPRTRPEGGETAEFLRETLTPFLLGTIEPSVLVLAASTAFDLGRLHSRGADAAKTTHPVSAKPQPDPDRGQGVEKQREALQTVLAAEPVDPRPLIAFVERSENRPPAAAFNLACFYTRTNDLSAAANWLLASVSDLPQPERKAMVQAATEDPTLAPLLRQRPGIVPKLNQLAAPPDAGPPESPDVLIHGLDLQSRVHDDLVAERWTVDWLAESWDFDLSARRGDQWRVIELSPNDKVTQDDVDRARGRLGRFRDAHPEGGERIEAVLLISAKAKLDGVDTKQAAGAGIRIEREAPKGSPHYSVPVSEDAQPVAPTQSDGD